MKQLISLVKLKKYFPLKGGLFQKRRFLHANEEITLNVTEGETLAVVGESGSGKSTLGKTLLGLLSPTFGTVIYRGKTLDEGEPKYLSKYLKNAQKWWTAYQKNKNTPFEKLNPDLQTALRLFGGFLTLNLQNFEKATTLLTEYYVAKKHKTNPLNVTQKLEKIKEEYSDLEEFKKAESHLDNGIEIFRLTAKEMRKLRQDLQIIFQDPYSSLNPKMTVGQIIEEGVATHGFYKKNSPEMHSYVLSVMEKCGLSKETYYRYPHQFSGGQRQRVCIARTLAVRPKFIVCDECVSALDCSIQSQILNLLMDLKEKENLTYLFISHDLSVVRHIADRVAVMYLGQIVELGKTEEVFNRPSHPYTLSLLSASPQIEKTKKQKIVLNGAIPSAVSPPKYCPFYSRCFMAQDICKRIPVPLKEFKKGRFSACHFAEISSTEKKKKAKVPLP